MRRTTATAVSNTEVRKPPVCAKTRGRSAILTQPRIAVLSSANGSTNLGDAAMWESAVEVVRKVCPESGIITDGHTGWTPPFRDIQVLPFAADELRRGLHLLGPELAGRMPRLDSLLSRHTTRGAVGSHVNSLEETIGRESATLQRWREVVATSNALIISGAGAMCDEYFRHGLASWRLLTSWARQSGTPVALVGQGIGPLTLDISRLHARKLLENAELVTVRDATSALIAHELVPEKEAIVTNDWAILRRPSSIDRSVARHVAGSLTSERPFNAVSVHEVALASPSIRERTIQQISSFVRQSERVGLAVVFVSNMTNSAWAGSDDRETARAFLGLASDEVVRNCYVIDQRLTSTQTRALLGLARGLLTTRYHPMVFALAEGTPAIGLATNPYYFQKLHGVAHLHRLDEPVVRLDAQVAAEPPHVERLLKHRVESIPDESIAAISSPLAKFLIRALGGPLGSSSTMSPHQDS